MALSLTLRRVLHRPVWEVLNPAPGTSAAGSFLSTLQLPAYNIALTVAAVNGTSSIWVYDPAADTSVTLPASGIAGTFGAGTCGCIHAMGPRGTAQGGTSTTIQLASGAPGTLLRDLRGYRIRITGGPGAGDERIIASNTLGANATITVTSAFSATITSSSTYQLLTPRLWLFNPSATTPGFGYYDFALGAWTASLSVSGVTFSGTDGRLTGTSGARGNILDSSDSAGGAPIATATTSIITLADPVAGVSSGRNWDTDMWAGGIIQILAGTGAGQTRHISSNTAKTLTVSAVFSPAPDATSVWQITRPMASSGSNSVAFSSATVSLLTLTGVNWTVNQWANYQIRAVAGTGAGQVRGIASNTATTLTPAANWTTQFDSSTIWVIEGNDNNLYLAGNAAVAMFKYSISANTWATAAATVARSVAPGAGLSLEWVQGVNDAAWTNENAILNGRYLYSFRGGATSALDVYDLALTTWTSTKAYANALETFTTGCSWDYTDGGYIVGNQGITGRYLYYHVVRNEMLPLGQQSFTQGAVLAGSRLVLIPFRDGSVTVPILYHWFSTSTGFLRLLCWHLR